jgi:drug/metabolite transporter (DMT)-like permease
MSSPDEAAVIARERLGFALGALGVLGFSATLPATRLAVMHLDPTLVGLGRSVLAALPALALLLFLRQPLPTRRQVGSLFTVAAGVIVGFPLLSAWAMERLPAAHGAVVIAVVPLFTAIAGAVRTRERPSPGFWLASAAGSGAVLVYAVVSGAGGLRLMDGVLLAAAALGAVGYAEGGRLAKEMGGWQVICWALVLAAPFLAVPVALAAWRHGLAAPPSAWLGFLYVSLVSQFVAFFLWYHGLAMGGVVRVSQVQLIQPFLTLGISAVLLGETVTPLMMAFAGIVVAAIAVGRRMPIAPAAGGSALARVE